MWCFSGCATAPPRAQPDRPAATLGVVQNATGDDALTALAEAALSEQLALNGIDPASFELVAKLEPSGDGLQLQILCSTRTDHLLKSHVQVKAHGGSKQKLVTSMMAKAARDLSADCR